MKKIILYCLFFLMAASLPARVCAQAMRSDTASQPKLSNPLPYRVAGAWKRDFSYLALPMMGAALYIKNDDQGFRSLPHTFATHSGLWGSDELRFLPIGVTALLKGFGVETRSSWKQLAVSTAFSGLITAGSTELLKRCGELRPDGSDRHSFPSGHASIAFMCATILHKELGEQSPWYSLAAYGFATFMGMERVGTSNHWPHDVAFGAGLGLVSTDLGYILSDLVVKDEKRSGGACDEDDICMENNSKGFLSVGMRLGLNSHTHTAPLLTFDGARGADQLLGLEWRQGAGLSASVEGACMLNRYIGVGGEARYSLSPVMVTAYSSSFQPAPPAGWSEADKREAIFYGIETENLRTMDVCAGFYLSLPLGPRWELGGKVLEGGQYIFPLHFKSSYNCNGLYTTGDTFLTLKGGYTLLLGAGIKAAYRMGNSYIEASMDCHTGKPTLDYSLAPSMGSTLHNGSLTTRISLWSAGLAFRRNF